MEIEITPAVASARHPKEWAALEKRLKGPGVRAHYRVGFVNWWKDTSQKPCDDLPKELLHTALNVKSLKLVATDSANIARAATLDMAGILTTQPQSLWPIELAGQDPAMRQSRRKHWPSISIARANRPEREVWQLAGLARCPFRGGFALAAQLVNGERTSVLVQDPANPKRLIDVDMMNHSLDMRIHDPRPDGSHHLYFRIARSYPAYMFGHRFVDPLTDQFVAKGNNRWTWFDAQSVEVAKWVSLHLTPLLQGFCLTLEDTPRLDLRDYRDDAAGKPRMVLR